MELRHDATAETRFERVDPQQVFVVAPAVPTSEVEERDTGLLVTEKVVPMKVTIRTSDQVSRRGVRVLAKERSGMQQSCSVPGSQARVPDQRVVVAADRGEIEDAGLGQAVQAFRRGGRKSLADREPVEERDEFVDRLAAGRHPRFLLELIAFTAADFVAARLGDVGKRACVSCVRSM
jgi:hypothetical protein